MDIKKDKKQIKINNSTEQIQNERDLINLYHAVSRIFIDKYIKEKLNNPSSMTDVN